MTQMPKTGFVPGFAAHHVPLCSCCSPRGVSRRDFLCTAAVGAAAAPAPPTGLIRRARAQQAPAGATTPGRAILIKGGTVLTLDRSVGDFDQADVLIENGKISAVRPNIDAANAEVIDAANTIVMPGFVDTHRHMWQGF